ncbi:MAG: VCBS repeat-containing protein [Pseudomonadota bacterium]
MTPEKAPRLPSRFRNHLTRGALLASFLAAATAGTAQEITSARYTDPTTRYAHGVLGDAIEHAGLEVTLSDGTTAKAFWPDTVVFEDTEPRLADVDGDGAPEVIVVESHERLGARMSVYGVTDGALKLLAANDFIGRSNRWLAVVGAADLDGDGAVEIAYVDRPHLAKTLLIWRYSPGDNPGALTLVGSLPGVTNHRIGERDIAGGIRDCGSGPEMLVADANWQRVLGVTFDGDSFRQTELGPHKGRSSFAEAGSC